MSTDLTLFTHPVFGNLRTIVDGETIYICAKDAATALGFVAPLLHGPPYVIGADGALGFTLDAGKAQLTAVTYKIVPRL
jgi:putative uncharacterized protein (fragment)